MDRFKLRELFYINAECLPERARQELRRLDICTATANPFFLLAERLGFTRCEAEIIQVTGRNSRDLQHSPFLALLNEYIMRNGSVGQLQYMLEEMGHVSQNVIPRYFNEILRNHQQSSSFQPPCPDNQGAMPSFAAGQQNTEPSYCTCPECAHAKYRPTQHLQPGSQQYPQPPNFSCPDSRNNGRSTISHGREVESVILPHEARFESDRLYTAQPPNSRIPENRVLQGPVPGSPSTVQGSSFSIPLLQERQGLPSQRPRAAPRYCIQNDSNDNSGSVQQSDSTILQTMTIDTIATDSTEEQHILNSRLSGELTQTMIDPRRNEQCCNCDECRTRSDPDETRVLRVVGLNKTCTREVPETLVERPCPDGSADFLKSEPYVQQLKNRYECNNDQTEVKTVNGAGQRGYSDSDETRVKRVDMCDYREDRENRQESVRHRNSNTGHVSLTSPQQQNMENAQNLVRAEVDDCSQNRSSLQSERHSWHEGTGKPKQNGLSTSSSTPEMQGPQKHRVLYERNSNSTINSLVRLSINTLENNLGTSKQNGRASRIMPELNIRGNSQSNSSNGYPSGSNDPSDSSESSNEPQSADMDITVFVTYSWNPVDDREEFVRDVVNLCRTLRELGVHVKIDMDPTMFNDIRVNKLDWIDQETSQAHFVVICISPTYHADIQPPVADQPSPGENQLNARYIFDKLRREYHENGSRNYRMIPIKFEVSGATDSHVPDCMRSTKVYSYPSDHQQIRNFIRNHPIVMM